MNKIARLTLQLGGVQPLTVAQLRDLIATISHEEWSQLLRLDGRERLLALIAANLERNGVLETLPLETREALRTDRLRALVTYTQQCRALAQLNRVFAADGISVVALKGVALAKLAYPDPETRPIGDIDLWVRAEDLLLADAALRGCDFAALPDNYSRPPAFLVAFADQRAYISSGELGPDSIDIDLHWHLVSGWWLRAALRIPEDQLFGSTVMVDVVDEPVPILNPTAALYYLCLHAGLHHQYGGVRWLIDLALLLRRYDIDWPLLRTMVQASGTRMIVWYALDKLDRMLGSEYAAQLNWRPARWHRRLVRRVLLSRQRSEQNSNRDLDAHPEQLILLPNAFAIATTLLRLLWPPAEWLRLRYSVSTTRGAVAIRLRHLARLRHLLVRG